MINKTLNVTLVLMLLIVPIVSNANPTPQTAQNVTVTSTKIAPQKNNSGGARRTLFAFLHVTALVVGAPMALVGTAKTPVHLVKGIATRDFSSTINWGCEAIAGYALTIYGYKGLCKDVKDLENDMPQGVHF